MDGLKFIALDADDLAVVSTHLQDAVVKVADIVWMPDDHRLVIGLNRFDWEATLDAEPQFRRRRAALRFDRVHGLQVPRGDAEGQGRCPQFAGGRV